MFCLSKRSNGFYYVFYDTPSGKRTCISSKTKYKVEANRFLSNFKEEIKKRNERKFISLSLSQFTSEFLIYSQTIHTPKTTVAYRQALNFLQKYFDNVRISEITNAQIVKYFENRVKTSSIYQARKDLICFNSCFNHAVKQKLLIENPCKVIKRFKIPEKQPLFFSKIDFEMLLRVIDNQDIKDLVQFAVNTGLRQMELLTLHWNQINFKDKTLILDNRNYQTKSKRIRSVPLNIKAFQILTERERDKVKEIIFTFNGKTVNPFFLMKQFKKYVIEAKLNPALSFHSLRHTFASWLIQRGISIYSVSKLLGHSNIKVTEIYSHLRSEDLMSSVSKLNN